MKLTHKDNLIQELMNSSLESLGEYTPLPPKIIRGVLTIINENKILKGIKILLSKEKNK
jgi:hypothetical protein